MTARVKVSVIIPTLNEEACLGHTLERLSLDWPAEVIVADGGSEDRTREIAERWARVIRTPCGRAIQQNHAAAMATGDVLLFLHADCWPEPGWQSEVESAVARHGFVVGCFQMRIDGGRWLYRAVEWGGDLRVRWLGVPYGDQGIFLRRDTFHELGGFPAVSLMEDLLFMRRARARGRVELLRHPIHISARRWETAGVMRQTMRNGALTALALWGGVHPDRLAKFYPAVR